jgi:hypothetical protein
MDGVREHGLLAAPEPAWEMASRRAHIIRELVAVEVLCHAAVDDAAAQLGLSRRHVYGLVSRWRAGVGLVSDLSEGTIGELANLLAEAAEIAITSGEESINATTLGLATYRGPSERRHAFERALS